MILRVLPALDTTTTYTSRSLGAAHTFYVLSYLHTHTHTHTHTHPPTHTHTHTHTTNSHTHTYYLLVIFFHMLKDMRKYSKLARKFHSLTDVCRQNPGSLTEQ